MSLQAPSRSDAAHPRQSDVRRDVHDAARRARAASRVLALLPTVAKDQALRSAAEAIGGSAQAILQANAEDLDAARAAGTSAAMLDRLALDHERLEAIAAGLCRVAGLPDPVGTVLSGYTLPNGLQLREQRVPTAEQLVRVLVVPAATVPAAPEEQIPAAAAADRVFQ